MCGVPAAIDRGPCLPGHVPEREDGFGRTIAAVRRRARLLLDKAPHPCTPSPPMSGRNKEFARTSTWAVCESWSVRLHSRGRSPRANSAGGAGIRPSTHPAGGRQWVADGGLPWAHEADGTVAHRLAAHPKEGAGGGEFDAQSTCSNGESSATSHCARRRGRWHGTSSMTSRNATNPCALLSAADHDRGGRGETRRAGRSIPERRHTGGSASASSKLGVEGKHHREAHTCARSEADPAPSPGCS